MNKEKNYYQKVYLFGFSKWKHDFIRSFLKDHTTENIVFINPIFRWSKHLNKALKQGFDENSQIYIWGRKEFVGLEGFAKENNITITRVEDGFIRSIDIGSNFTRPYSLIFDDVGIYFDATRPSKLENILNTCEFEPEVLAQAEGLQKKILSTRLSKYNNTAHKEINLPCDKTKILVPGQVESDASIIYGTNGMTNLELLKRVRDNNPNAYIVYKPHPDVLSGNRKGEVSIDTASQYCDKVVKDTSIASLLRIIDEVHTMTSLVGFEGLIYGKKVVTYGMPFYAGWGLTNDFAVELRRKRKLTTYELIAGAYILYPKYIGPDTLEYCSPVQLLDKLYINKKASDNSYSYSLRGSLNKLFRKVINIFIAK